MSDPPPDSTGELVREATDESFGRLKAELHQLGGWIARERQAHPHQVLPCHDGWPSPASTHDPGVVAGLERRDLYRAPRREGRGASSDEQSAASADRAHEAKGGVQVTTPRVHMMGNGLWDSYLLSWPGGGTNALTYEKSLEVGRAKATELGVEFVDESPRTLGTGSWRRR